MEDHSLRDKIQGNWKQLNGSVRSEWGKLTHNDVEQVKGDVEILSGKIQERYGVTATEAKKQIKHWVDMFKPRETNQASSDTPAS
ncbi:MAG TPA: CsbD family protein [Ktedonobacteraceae bacterium]|nr:CsbD family protein [Ktedonobacteraceae bacterium]